jgi:linoleate 9S-lipoxygenase
LKLALNILSCLILPRKFAITESKSTLIRLKLGILWCLADSLRGKLGKVADVEKWVTTRTPLTAGETIFTITFEWDENMGLPGAIIIKNHHHSQLYLKTVTLEDVPGHGRVLFICNSWVYPSHRYKYNRVFFSNKVIRFWNNPINRRLCADNYVLLCYFCE